MSRPRGQHLEPLAGMPRHLPGCTEAYRAEDGCWCAHHFYYGVRLPTARQWRAQRRRAVRVHRGYELMWKRHGIPPQHDLSLTHWWAPDLAGPLCDPRCPAAGFVFERDWPPTVTSWKGLLR